jgi:hypothetical protein
MNVQVGEAGGVATGQKLSQVHRKVRVVELSAHGDTVPMKQAEDAITW